MPAATMTSNAASAIRCVRPSTTVVVFSVNGVGGGTVATAGLLGEVTGVPGLVAAGRAAGIADEVRIAVGVRCGTVMSMSSGSPGGVGVESVGISPSACGVTAEINAARNSSAL